MEGEVGEVKDILDKVGDIADLVHGIVEPPS